MSSNHDDAGTLGLHFFGSMTASISHEVKNVLAIVNENAGLLEDLALLAEKGRPLSPERLKLLSGNIHRQVQRADDIIRRLNRFSHSTHEPATTGDIGEIFDFTAALVARLATMKGLAITVAHETPVQIKVRPFVLENLLWICLKNVLAVTRDSGTVTLAAEDLGGQVVITLQLGDGLPVTALGEQVASEGQALLTALRAEVSTDPDHHLIRLKMPALQD